MKVRRFRRSPDAEKVDGFELARQIRASSWNKSTPIVVVTGQDDTKAMQKVFAAGTTFFLQKAY
jgi:PleD family two-component response regulator